MPTGNLHSRRLLRLSPGLTPAAQSALSRRCEVAVQITFCGTRGSTPAPGKAYVRYGGHTSCVALAHDGAAAPTLILDGGTGLANLDKVLGEAPFEGTILLGHL